MIAHWITKRIVKETRRVFFKNSCKVSAEILIEFKGIGGMITLYTGKLQNDPSAHWFYIDVPANVWRRTWRFKAIVHQDRKPLWDGEFKDSGKYEDLYEGKK